MESNGTPKLGLIGLGLMGNALASRITQAKFPLIGYDLNPDQQSAFTQAGFKTAPDPATVFKEADWIIYAVMTTDQVRQSLEENQPHLKPGQIVVDCSTGQPDEMANIGRWLSSFEIEYIDATIAGNSKETHAGNVLALVGGSDDAVQRCRPFFNSFAKQVFHLGPQGFGARMKLVFNLVLGLNRAVLAEGLSFASKLSIPQETALEILKSGSTFSYVMENKGDKMLREDFSPQAKLEQHLKDVDLILALARQKDAKTPFSHCHQDLLHHLTKEGYGSLDNSAILKAFQ